MTVDEFKLREALVRAGLTIQEAATATPRLLQAKADADARCACAIDPATVPCTYDSWWENYDHFGYC